ncbi:MAG: Tol-Pal system beta propeller repeat protein TolB [Gammaproteobacteria bacterium]
MKFLITLWLCLVSAMAVAQVGGGPLTIRITQGVEGALPIAIVPFEWTGQPLPQDIAQVITNDLTRSGRFNVMPAADLPARPSDVAQVNFKDWRTVGMDNLVIGRITATADGGYVVEFRLLDVFGGKQLAGFQIPSHVSNLRLTAHHISDIIFKTLLNIDGAFSTRIAYVTVDRKDAKNSLYRLQIADADGYDAKTILESPQPLMSPAWSPDGNRLAYVSFEERNSAIYVQDVRTGAREKVVSGLGINSSPAFAPDGRRLAVTRSMEGNPDIYVVDIASKQQRRLTTHEAIDTEAAWAPDGSAIIFTSDRGGGPQIYRMSPDGGDAKRVTFNLGNYNSRASYSPDGKKLVMVNGGSGFRIVVLDLATGSSRVLTGSSLDESPSFAPNGSMIIYATMGGRGTELAAVSVDGTVKQRLALQVGQVREPAWGPFRK